MSNIFPAKLVLYGCIILFFVSEPGYAMQPPPPPLNSAQFQELIAEADVIVVGRIEHVEKSEGVNGARKKITIEVVLKIEKVLKGKIPGKDICIKESYPSFSSVTIDPTSKENIKAQKTIISTVAGPRCYYGRYKEDTRIIALLAVIEGTNQYKPLGSGTYDKHLCEFLIENGSIKTLYFRFADDVEKHAHSEDEFIGLIKRLLKKNQADDPNRRWWLLRLLF